MLGLLPRAGEAGGQGVQLGDNAALLSRWWNRDSLSLQYVLTNVGLRPPLPKSNQLWLPLPQGGEKEPDVEFGKRLKEGNRLIGRGADCSDAQFPDGGTVHRDEDRTRGYPLR